MIPAPGVVGRNIVQRDAHHVTHEGLRLFHYIRPPARMFTGSYSAISRTNCANSPGTGSKWSGPGRRIPRPREPHARLRLPFSGPAVAEFGGSVVLSIHRCDSVWGQKASKTVH